VRTPHFGRLPQLKDHRDWLLCSTAPLPHPTVSRHLFRRGPTLDQGATPRCVAFAWLDLLTCGPMQNKIAGDPDPQEIYDLAQKLDEYAGENYDGTSVRGGAKAISQLGLISSYAFTTSPEEAAAAILTRRSPVVFGSDWMADMSTLVQHRGHPFARATGAVEGGHAYLLYGVDRGLTCPDGTLGAFRFQNSWGEDGATRAARGSQ
jgi:hypothetical protein